MNSIKIEETPDNIDIIAVFREVNAACDRWFKARGMRGDWDSQIDKDYRIAKAKKA